MNWFKNSVSKPPRHRLCVVYTRAETYGDRYVIASWNGATWGIDDSEKVLYWMLLENPWESDLDNLPPRTTEELLAGVEYVKSLQDVDKRSS